MLERSTITRRKALRIGATASVAGALSALSPAQEGSVPPVSERRPNILMIHCHDLGQFLHCYGVETVQTPNLDTFAAEGVRFARSFCTAPQCSPSRASLFTGRYPVSNGVMGLTHANFAWDMRRDEKHLAQSLKDAGYSTTAVGVTHEVRDIRAGWGYDEIAGPGWASKATDVALEKLKALAAQEAPFYLYVGFIEPHRLPRGDQDMGFINDEVQPDDTLGVSVPGFLRDTEGTRAELAELQGAVRHVDTQVGRILEALRDLGLEQDTLVILTTDHGYAMPRAKCNLYDPGIAVALMLRLPSRPGWHGGAAPDPMISNIDVLPSILDLLGIPVPANVQGQSFVPLLDGGDYQTRDALFCELSYHDYYDPKRCVRTETHKLIVNFTTAPAFMDPSQSWRPRSDTVVPKNHALAYHDLLELYDLTRDPWELRNVADDPAYADVRADLLARLRAHLLEVNDPILRGAITPPSHRQALELLGA